MEPQDIASYSFDLSGRIVHIWPVRTETPSSVAVSFEPYLSPDEKGRAAQFRFERHRNSFVVARGILRILLGRYLNIPPAGFLFRYGPKGKPAIAGSEGIDFNLSHSGSLAVFAFTAGCELGIDVERIRPLPDMQSIADRFFCSEEAAELMSLPANQREHGFYLCWTRKEAYIKASSDGLSAPLDGFRVTLRPGQTARFIHLSNDTGASQAWSLHDLRLASDYAAALAYRDAERPIVILPVVDPTELPGIHDRRGTSLNLP
ncbi:MAG: 4'-phosphopantetheinyl transferase superfamily protein [Bryobacteraceae bacterium]|jgi:4'-phosphopantetheinyl transferase